MALILRCGRRNANDSITGVYPRSCRAADRRPRRMAKLRYANCQHRQMDGPRLHQICRKLRSRSSPFCPQLRITGDFAADKTSLLLASGIARIRNQINPVLCGTFARDVDLPGFSPIS